MASPRAVRRNPGKERAGPCTCGPGPPLPPKTGASAFFYASSGAPVKWAVGSVMAWAPTHVAQARDGTGQWRRRPNLGPLPDVEGRCGPLACEPMVLVDHIDTFAAKAGLIDDDARLKLLAVLDSRERSRLRAANDLLGGTSVLEVAKLAIELAADPSMRGLATAQLREVVVHTLEPRLSALANPRVTRTPVRRPVPHGVEHPTA